ncbi:GH39 family glycosyl hydrolase [Longispora fulva]|uniref:GH39 family glycosyl hydrolase n=1 Tax=Longispora fulva TaxID=619741 RepID=UPI0018C939C7|nr:hypothetical protein [Longispora fulva]
MRRKLAIVAVCVAGSLVGQTATAAEATTTVTANLTVDASVNNGPLNNHSRFINSSRSGFLQAPLSAGERAQLRDDLHVRTTRMFFAPKEVYDPATNAYNLSAYDANLAEVSTYSDRLLVSTTSLWENGEWNTTPKGTLVSPAVYGQVLTTALRDYKARYPKIEYIECWNEPNAPEHGNITMAKYYEYYKACYEAANTVNAALNPTVPLKVGGPCPSNFNATLIPQFLDLYKADANPAKRLDFVSYHEYAVLSANPKIAYTEKSTVVSWLTARGLDPATPVFVTEYGLYPGGSTGTDLQDLAHDQLVQAAGMASTSRYFMLGGTDAAFHWAIRHKTNDRKDILVDGAEGVLTPYGHMIEMQAKLKSDVVEVTPIGGASVNGIGLQALATADSSGVSVMYWNYQADAGTTAYKANITVKNLPASFAGKRIRLERWLVDATHSNYRYDPAQTTLTKVEDNTYPAGTQITKGPGLPENSIGLMVLTPVP